MDSLVGVPAPQPVPPPFRTWEEYRAAMGKDKARRMSHEERMAGAPQAHAKVSKEVDMSTTEIDKAVAQEEYEEEQRKVWTREAAARLVGATVRAPVTRSSIIDEAKSIINGERQQAYDAPEDNFGRIARHWCAFFENRYSLAIDITPADVSLLMDLVKTARLEFNITHKDSWVDKVGYSACGAECALNRE